LRTTENMLNLRRLGSAKHARGMRGRFNL
jgi:hypothetical protein